MIEAEHQYRLAAGDIVAVRQLLIVQQAIMSGHDDGFDPSQNTQIVKSFMDGIAALSSLYAGLSNLTLKAWVDQLYQRMIEHGYAQYVVAYNYDAYARWVRESGGLEREGTSTRLVCVLAGFPPKKGVRSTKWEDAMFCQTYGDIATDPWLVPSILFPTEDYNSYIAFTNGLQDAVHPERYLPPWRGRQAGDFRKWTTEYPSAPAPWSAAVNAVLESWGDKPPLNLIDKWIDQESPKPWYWTDFDQVRTSTAPLWQTQVQAASTLLAAPNLTADAYLVLMHLLIVLAIADAPNQQLASRIVSAPAESPSYPNDIFVNQLVYLVLMHLADPDGPFGWPNEQRQAMVRDLAGAIVRSDPASTALRASLQQHLRILISDTSYPMQDPYSGLSFTQRKTDALFALDKARAMLKP